jgi:CBS domain-containing protein
VQARDVMTRNVVAVGPGTSAKSAGEVMAERGFAALPVVDDAGRLVGIVAEADVLRNRIPQDPLLHLRRDAAAPPLPGLLAGQVMTASVVSVEPTADVADLARLFVDDHLRSVPVVHDDVLVGIVSRRDVLRVLVRPDADIRLDVLHLVEAYTGEPGIWEVSVLEGMTTVRRVRGVPQESRAVEEFALERLAATVPGVIAVRIGATPAAVPAPTGAADR